MDGKIREESNDAFLGPFSDPTNHGIVCPSQDVSKTNYCQPQCRPLK